MNELDCNIAPPVVWVTGGGGLIGNCLVRTAPRFAPGCQVIGLTRQGLNLTDFAGVRRRFQEDKPQLVIHCAGLTRSPACEQNSSLARKLNIEVTACLDELAADVPFIFFSSDLVFDGSKGNYSEMDEPRGWCVYSENKIAAEQIILANPRHTVVRISLNGGTSPTGDRGFNEEMRRAWQAGRTLKLFTDEFRCPMAAVVTTRAVWELVAQNKPGLYHLAGAERLCRWQIGQLIAARWPQLNPRIEPSSRRNYVGPARPADTSLNCAKIQKWLSFPLPGLSEWLKANPNEPF
jgi:dTDP-4-dehydrorhamnose reductase